MRDATSVATVVGARLSLKPYGKGSFMAIDIGISEEDRKSIVDGLSRLLSDTYVLYLKTHNFHWNVTGPSFRTLHLMFEEQYNELALAVDSIAERIRALGFPAPGSYAFMHGTRRSRRRKASPGRRDDPPVGSGAGGRGTHCAQHFPCGGQGQ